MLVARGFRVFIAWALAGALACTSSAPDPVRAPDAQAACSVGMDQTCNDDPSISSLWGRCVEPGVCECREGFMLNERGRCQSPD